MPDQDEALPEEVRRDRRAQLELDEFELNPGSLVGSYFLAGSGETAQAGMVVGEVQPGKYLLDFEPAAAIKPQGLRPQEQRIVTVDEVVGTYRFFDSEEQMRFGISDALNGDRVPHD